MAFKKSISFGTAEELARKRENEFLALTPHERFERFIMMIQESYVLFGRQKPTASENYVLERP